MPVNYNKPLIIRDGRNGNWFWVDKEVWNDNRLSSSDKVVYGTLAYFANQKSQESYPGIGELAVFSGITPRQVYRSIKKLEELEHIHIQRTHGKENHYTLLDNGINHLKEKRGDNMSGVNKLPQGGDNKEVGGVTNKHYEQYIYNKNISTNVDNQNGGESVEKIKGYGNPDVNQILKEFSEITGLSKPVDKDPRFWAWQFSRNKLMGVSNFSACLKYIIAKWDGRVEVSKLEMVYRHFPEFQRDVLDKRTKSVARKTEIAEDGSLIILE